MRSLKLFFVSLVVALLANGFYVGTAVAGACTSFQSGNWSDSATWVGTCSGTDGIPAAGDNVTVGHTVTLTANSSVATGSVTVHNGGILNLANFTLNAATLTIENGGEVQQGGGSTAPTGTITTRDYQAGSTYTFNGTQAGLSGNHPTYYNLNFYPTPTTAGTFALDLNVLNDLIIGLGADREIRFGTGATSRTHTIGGDLIIQASGTVVGNNGSAAANVTIGGDLMVSTGATLRGTNSTGDANFAVEGNVINNGSWVVGSSTSLFAFTLNGSSTQTISGNPVTIDTLTIADSASVVIPASTVVLGLLTNNGTIQQTQNVTGPGNFTFLGLGSYGGVQFTTSNNLGSTTVVIRGHQACDTTNSTVRRCFDIAPTNALATDIAFYFDNEELNGSVCANANVYRWSSGWNEIVPASRQCDTEPYSLVISNQSDFSPFVIRAGTPTAVTLHSLSTTAATPLWVVLLITVTALAAAATLIRRRRLA
jgi:hypothetical protein